MLLCNSRPIASTVGHEGKGIIGERTALQKRRPPPGGQYVQQVPRVGCSGPCWRSMQVGVLVHLLTQVRGPLEVFPPSDRRCPRVLDRHNVPPLIPAPMRNQSSSRFESAPAIRQYDSESQKCANFRTGGLAIRRLGIQFAIQKKFPKNNPKISSKRPQNNPETIPK